MAKIRIASKKTPAAHTTTIETAPTGATTASPMASASGAGPAPAPSAWTAVSPPAAADTVPNPPIGFTAANLSEYRGLLPKASQLTALPDVIKELNRFTDYVEVFGKTAPPLQWVLQTFTAANAWSQMHIRNAAWDAFTRTQEGAAWKDVHTAMERMQPALELAVKGDATVATQYPALVRLFGAASVIAQKSVATKKANKKKTDAGELPTSGKVGKQRHKAAANAALAEKTAAAQPPAQTQTPAAPTPPVATTPVATTPANVAHS